MIYCVEDDESIRDIEVYTLSSTGFEARGFSDGRAFFEALEDELPDLVILDVMLPGEDGVSLLKRIKASPATRDLPVIMATAKGMEYDKISSLDRRRLSCKALRHDGNGGSGQSRSAPFRTEKRIPNPEICLF